MPRKGESTTKSIDFEELYRFEQLYLETAGRLLRSKFKNRYNFLGFAYRGILLRGGRQHAMRMSESVRRKLSSNGGLSTKKAEMFLQILTRLYLEKYGSATSMNNLVLETQYQLVKENQPQFIHLSFGDEDSGVDNHDGVRRIRLSKRLVKELGGDLEVWDEARTDIRKLLDSRRPDQIAQYLPELRSSILRNLARADQHLQRSSWYVVQNESKLVYELSQCTFQGDLDNFSVQTATREVMSWLRAFQGLLLFQLFGAHWITVPVQPYFKRSLEALGLFVPFSAVTTITDEPEVSGALLQLAGQIAEAGAKNHHDSFASAVRTISLHGTRSPVFLRALKTNLINDDLLELARSLIQSTHEGERLEFTLLCAPESVLLRLYRGSDSWSLTPVDRLESSDFNMNHFSISAKTKNSDVIKSSIMANALILQEPGAALFFMPHDLLPREIVKFYPFDASRLDLILREFTRDGSGIAIQVRSKDARLFHHGKVVARAGFKTSWEPVADALGSGNGSQLVEAIKVLPWSSGLPEKGMMRIGQICSTVVEVAERGYGGLFFIVRESNSREEKLPERSPMAPVWGTSKARRVEDISPPYLASFAGLDGETFIDIESGEFSTRQFLLIPDGRFLKFWESIDGQLKLTKDFQRYCEEMSSSKSQDRAEDIIRFGTRHQKALRITYAFPATTIAITVSADGPIRLWHRGYSVAKFSV